MSILTGIPRKRGVLWDSREWPQKNLFEAHGKLKLGMPLTFVGESFAKTGFRFVCQGAHHGCDGCKLFPVCQAPLEYSRVYEVVDVRGRQMDCPKELHEERMVLVEVVEAPPRVNLESQGAFVGATNKFVQANCELLECPWFFHCVPAYGAKKGDRLRILSASKLPLGNCAKGRRLCTCHVERIT